MTNLPSVREPDDLMEFGATKMRPGDFIPPRVKILQQMSQEVADKDGQAGDLFNVLTRENYGTELKVLPILPFMQRILLVRDDKRKDIEARLGDALAPGQGLMCRSYDMDHGQGSPGGDCATCPLAAWDDTTGAPPYCTESHNIAAMNELGELVVLSFQKSSAKVGRRLFSILRMRPGKPWTSWLTVTTKQTKNDKGNFFVADVAVNRDPVETALTQQALTWAQQLRGVVMDVTPGVDDEEGGAPEGSDPF